MEYCKSHLKKVYLSENERFERCLPTDVETSLHACIQRPQRNRLGLQLSATLNPKHLFLKGTNFQMSKFRIEKSNVKLLQTLLTICLMFQMYNTRHNNI